ncbi:hypothetical protein YB2330_004938 [Saitoella coloradoensis]
MGPKKKSKKPAANPARGFATTSIARKVDPEPKKSQSLTPDPTSTPGTTTSTTLAENAEENANKAKEVEDKKELKNEEQLATSIRKTAERFIARQIDAATVENRQRSGYDTIRIPEPLVDRILKLAKASGEVATIANGETDDKALEKVWITVGTLGKAGVKDEVIEEVIRTLGAVGVEEALEWIYVNKPAEDLEGAVRYGDVPVPTPIAATPIREPSPPPKKRVMRKKEEEVKPPSRKEAMKGMMKSPTDEELEEDPTAVWVSLSLHLLSLQRNLGRAKKRALDSYASSLNASAEDEDPVEVARREVKNMEAEIKTVDAWIKECAEEYLFEKPRSGALFKAGRQDLQTMWREEEKVEQEEEERKREELAKEMEAASLDDPVEEADAAAADTVDVIGEEGEGAPKMADAAEPAPVADDDEVDLGLGDMSFLLEDPYANEPPPEIPTTPMITFTILNFPGPYAPERTLQDAVRKKDSGAAVYYDVKKYSNCARASVKIRWGRDRGMAEDKFEMPETIAINKPEAARAYVATIALFELSLINKSQVGLLFSKAFKGLWEDLEKEKGMKILAEDVEQLKKLKSLLGDGEGKQKEVITTRAKAKAKGTDTGTATPQEEVTNGQVEGVESFVQEWDRISNRNSYRIMEQKRRDLPMWGWKERILNMIEEEQVLIVCGETGCGKSTQLPSFLLEHSLSRGRPCKVYVTEPRRISALSLAQRVSQELGEQRGAIERGQSVVGYAIRLESMVNRNTRLVFATTGIVLRMLEGENGLEEVTHLVVDEVHERSIDSDFLLIILKQLLQRRKDLKVILMSATVNAERFSEYLGGCKIVNVPGRTFPVQQYFLEDALEVTGYALAETSWYAKKEARMNRGGAVTNWEEVEDEVEDLEETDAVTSSATGYSAITRRTLDIMDEYKINFDLIVKLLEKIALDPDQQFAGFSQAILVFLPGLAEIRRLMDVLSAHQVFGREHLWVVHALHSSIPSEKQAEAFEIPLPGCRKIVLSTDIAETGVTIPDITAVIDCGKHKEMRYDERRQMSRLIECFVAKANAKQRQGRAGRVQPGICFHLFTKERHAKMLDSQIPEIMRLSLQDLALRVKICKLEGSIESVLGQALDSPSPDNVRRAILALQEVDALTTAEDLTPLGRHLAMLPVDVYLGKLILLGIHFKCLDAAFTIAAVLSSKSPFVTPMGMEKQADAAKQVFKTGESDFLTVWTAYDVWRKTCNNNPHREGDFCRRSYLSGKNLRSIEELRGQYMRLVVDAGFVSLAAAEKQKMSRSRFVNVRDGFFAVPPQVNTHINDYPIISACVAMALYPRLLTVDPNTKTMKTLLKNQPALIHPSSVNYQDRRNLQAKFMAYYTLMKSRNVNAFETGAVDASAVALLCGEADFKSLSGLLFIDHNRVKFAVESPRALVALRILRTQMEKVLVRFWRNPGKTIAEEQETWLAIGMELLKGEEEKTQIVV